MEAIGRMVKERPQRRLAAILAADVVGYSGLVEQNEGATLVALKERFNGLLVPLVAGHQGRIVQQMGDGVLAEFASVVDAVQCAVELQRRNAEANAAALGGSPLVLRIGVNLGDVVVDGLDIQGDGVNVAAGWRPWQSLAAFASLPVSSSRWIGGYR